MSSRKQIAESRSIGFIEDIYTGFREHHDREGSWNHIHALRQAPPDQLLAAVMIHIDRFPEPMHSEAIDRGAALVKWLGGATTAEVADVLEVDANDFHRWKHQFGQAIGALIPLDQLAATPPE